MSNHKRRDFEQIVSALGPPDYEREGIALYNRDCIEGMRLIRSSRIDLTVTSPPYNIGKEYETPLELSQYLLWSREWIETLHRVTAPSGSFWLNLGYISVKGKAKAIPLPYLIWDKVPFHLIQEVVWHYGAGVASRQSFSPRNEKFLWYVKSEAKYTFNLDEVRDKDVKYPNQKKNGKLKCNPLGKNPSDVWNIPKVTSGANRSSVERTAHPAQFPIALVERIIKSSSNEGDIVLDPFMGSGTTAAAARKLGRQVIGFELSKQYLDLASKRLKNAIELECIAAAQCGLFTDAI